MRKVQGATIATVNLLGTKDGTIVEIVDICFATIVPNTNGA